MFGNKASPVTIICEKNVQLVAAGKCAPIACHHSIICNYTLHPTACAPAAIWKLKTDLSAMVTLATTVCNSINLLTAAKPAA